MLRIAAFAVGLQADLQPADAWGDRAAASKIVFIGRELDAAAIDAGLRGCLAA